MRQLLRKGITLFFGMFFVGMYHTQAQDDLQNLLESGKNDASKLAQGYVAPFMNAFGNGMSNGWYNTAKAHKTLGFDLTVTVNAAMVPSDETTYSVSSLGLQNIALASGQSDQVPTMFGPKTKPSYVTTNTTPSQTFSGPEGLGIKESVGLNAVPVPMAQLGIGIVKNTDLKIRWTPKVKLGDNGEFQMWGVGVMHDVKQYIPGLKNMPFDLAGFVGYTKMNLSASLIDTNQSANVQSADGKAVFEASSLTIQGLISKKFSVLTLYGGVGYNNVKSRVAMEGTYQIKDDSGLITDTLTNPVELNFGASGPRVTAGFRLKLAILTLHADYTLQKYSTLTAGIGFAVR